ncbi:hypothetical protein CV725_01825 [Helicobacter pylori B128]|nr:hypothetical protein BXP12_01815 [Helicobacter pylori]AVG80844.1 hypothetical protein BXP17_01820 [Helicobacter pylori]QDW68304.1 hypothetical protein D5R83_01815 [Helicobacter pylori]QDY52989.1 hypothetical protein CV723_01820 [Helicobacter pylori]QDY55939.1 hypothetical protein CV725_01825 [Helicobacter pylori B128]
MRSKTSKHSQTPFYIHHFRSKIVSCNEKFYTIFMNFKTNFKIFSLKAPLQKIRLNRIKILSLDPLIHRKRSL